MPARTTRTRPVEPLSEEDYQARCDCRCRLVRGTHPAGVCAQIRDTTTTAATTNGGRQ